MYLAKREKSLSPKSQKNNNDNAIRKIMKKCFLFAYGFKACTFYVCCHYLSFTEENHLRSSSCYGYHIASQNAL